ncbi:hypothetical protein GCM10011371_09350 [Novosphingobium marinum]|uniref:DUF962 domain-containing protein n=1 Tax=Novosphingobium marinum TaxID=1514948 RepID=A0A7Y9XXV1_9SPHN|nr:hypothetical protein [Novosphingobium marinum]NYH95041.1 hypothetical protein [Novosphingobium marinum]GGC23802.1 hypothetical protein GCM10011371_09350 [Novosphingobium marinum]
MNRFREQLREQRWDDHRYYHHSLINQSLHFLSAITFLVAYVVVWQDPALAALLAWGVAMTSRQAGHFFFEPKGYDDVNDCTHEYKEDIKVGYNLARKVVLMGLWAFSPIVLYVEPTFFGVFEAHRTAPQFFEHLGLIWLALGIGGLVFRTVHLFFIRDVETGLVWAAKIITDPFNDFRLYCKAPGQLVKQRIDARHTRAG